MKVEIQTSGRDFVLLEDFRIQTKYGWMTIPKGTKTDLASIPKVFWNIISPLEAHFPAAVMHDVFYRMPESRKKWGITREMADDMFLEEMADLDIPVWKRQLMHWAVRMGGNSSWRE